MIFCLSSLSSRSLISVSFSPFSGVFVFFPKKYDKDAHRYWEKTG